MGRLLALLAAVATAQAGLAADCPLDYRFRADWSTPEPRFDVRLEFDGGERTQTRLRISPEWAGVTDFHRGIRHMRVEGTDASITPDDAPYRWMVQHAGGSRIVIRYEVVNTVPRVDDASPMNHRDFYRNTLGATRFQMFGHGALVRPEHLADSDAVSTCFAFDGLDPGWSFASNHMAGQRGGQASWRVAASPQELRSSLFLGGDYRLHRRDIAGRPLWIALRGRWAFADAQLVDATAKVVESHRRFWDDFDFPHYLISLSPNRVSTGSTGGTGLRNAFAMHASDDFAVPSRAFDHILVHEHLHTWVPRRLGTMGEQEAQHYWFSEGFTNYLTHRLLLLSGVWKLEDYARALNEELRRYHTSPARDATNARLRAEFWTDKAVQEIPYRRGELFAIHLAGRMAAKGASLDGTLRSLRLNQDAVPKESARREEDLAVHRLQAALRPSLGDAAEADFHAYIEEGRAIPIGADFLGPCFDGKWMEKPLFELGFDAAIVHDTWKLGAVVAGSAAEKAGLREGMEVRGWSYSQGQPQHEVNLKIREEGGVREVKYLPIAARGAQVPQFTVKAGAVEDAACRKWVNG